MVLCVPGSAVVNCGLVESGGLSLQPDTKHRSMVVFTTIEAGGAERGRRDMGVIILELVSCVNKVPRLQLTVRVS